MKKKKAILSVYDKTNIVPFAQNLVEKFNYEIVSTGGTEKVLQEAGIETIEIETLTNFPEMLNGRVKTLHPKVHGGILARRNNEEDLSTLSKHNISLIDLVVVNLYPFSKVAENKDATLEELIENIDIGGPTLLRSAAKNYESVTVCSSPEDYDTIIEDMSNNNGETSISTRKRLAVKAFEHTHNYDNVIYHTLNDKFDLNELPETININLTKVKELRYGENPHQSAGYYVNSRESSKTLPMKVLQGKELSYNNFVDITAALKIINEFSDNPAACIIKHNNPCGVALGNTTLEAYNKALSADPISAFGGIVSVNREINEELAKVMSELFLEVISAPYFTEEARAILSKKKNLRLIEVSKKINLHNDYVIKQVIGGILIQDDDVKSTQKEDLKIVSKISPTDEQINDLLFAWKIAKHVSSNAIVIAKNSQTVGIGCGQTSRIAAMEIALKQACDEAKDAVIASDGFFPAIDNIHAAAQSRISAIIQPGGSIKDNDVILETDKLGLSMVFTSTRHFRH